MKYNPGYKVLCEHSGSCDILFLGDFKKFIEMWCFVWPSGLNCQVNSGCDFPLNMTQTLYLIVEIVPFRKVISSFFRDSTTCWKAAVPGEIAHNSKAIEMMEMKHVLLKDFFFFFYNALLTVFLVCHPAKYSTISFFHLKQQRDEQMLVPVSGLCVSYDPMTLSQVLIKKITDIK